MEREKRRHRHRGSVIGKVFRAKPKITDNVAKKNAINMHALQLIVAQLLFVVGLVQLFLVVILPTGGPTDSVGLHVNSYAKVVCFIGLGLFFMFMYYDTLGYIIYRRVMKIYRVIVIVVAILCFVKALLTLIFPVLRYTTFTVVWAFYIGEALVWMMLGVFLLTFRRINLKMRKSKGEKYKGGDGKTHHRRHSDNGETDEINDRIIEVSLQEKEEEEVQEEQKEEEEESRHHHHHHRHHHHRHHHHQEDGEGSGEDEEKGEGGEDPEDVVIVRQ